MYANEKDEHECRRLLSEINQYEKETAISAEGYFTIERSTLVSMLGTLLTYIIILVQFFI